MIHTDVLIVGGGPAGSACARRLRQNGADCLILDQHSFPRFKTCAGWITPEVLRSLELKLADYPHSLTIFNSFEVSLRGLHFRLRTRQFAIRRYELDHWLLRQSGAPFQVHTVKSIVSGADGYVVDGEFSCRYLVGAGGTRCPVRRALFETASPRDKDGLVVAMEEEFLYPYEDPRCRLWFMENGLPGYAWYVPKTGGYLNVGIGGKAAQLRDSGDTLKKHWNLLVGKLDQLGLVRGHTYQPVGHSYYLRPRRVEVRRENAFLLGDAAGLATLDMGEGIGPAILSGMRAAEAITHGSPYSLARIPRYSFLSILASGITLPWMPQ